MSVSQCETPAAREAELGGVLREYMDVALRLQRTHETLQQEVERLRRELASKDQELERRRRLASLGELAAGVAHEVRNPLGAIQLYSGLLRGECRRRPPALELIEKIEAGIRAIDRVVQDTLALAPRPRQFERQPLQTILEEAREACRRVLDERQVRLDCRYADRTACVAADADGLRRVFINLLVNAAEASPPGAVVHVFVGAESEQAVEIRVSDEGPGLPEELLDRIFDPFFTTKENGTGLGLTIVHRLVEAHGGTLAARNRSEGGAEFVLTLPTVSVAKPVVHADGAARRPHVA